MKKGPKSAHPIMQTLAQRGGHYALQSALDQRPIIISATMLATQRIINAHTSNESNFL
jgi:hypothetical protein